MLDGTWEVELPGQDDESAQSRALIDADGEWSGFEFDAGDEGDEGD
jgi:hypothetical protein